MKKFKLLVSLSLALLITGNSTLVARSGIAEVSNTEVIQNMDITEANSDISEKIGGGVLI